MINSPERPSTCKISSFSTPCVPLRYHKKSWFEVQSGIPDKAPHTDAYFYRESAPAALPPQAAKKAFRPQNCMRFRKEKNNVPIYHQNFFLQYIFWMMPGIKPGRRVILEILSNPSRQPGQILAGRRDQNRLAFVGDAAVTLRRSHQVNCRNLQGILEFRQRRGGVMDLPRCIDQ